MKVIIPLAGKGTRLRPHTHLSPKPMLKVAGKPVMDYVLEDLAEARQRRAGRLHHRAPQGEGRGTTRAKRSRFPAVFIEQKVQDGTAGAVALARPYVDQPVLIIFVDTIFDADLSVINTTDADGIIWVKEVEDYQRFGVVVTDADGNMTKIVEKPNDADLEAREHRAVLHQELEAAVRGDRPRAHAAEEQGRVLPHRRVPVHDRQGREDQGDRRRRLVRRGQARHAARDEPRRCSRRGARAGPASIDARRRSSIRCTSRTASPSPARRIGPNVSIGAGSHHRQLGDSRHGRSATGRESRAPSS